MTYATLLTTYSASSLRRYIPKADFNCITLNRLHSQIRSLFRALNSYKQPDHLFGPRYKTLSQVSTWLERNLYDIERLTNAGYTHPHLDGHVCEECQQALETGFHVRALAVAADIIEVEKARVAAEVVAL